MPSAGELLERALEHVKRETAVNHRREVDLIERLLAVYLMGLNGWQAPMPRSELYDAMTVLVTRSFNSMRCAHSLLERGYYSQAMMLIRSVDEDWFTCSDCQYRPETLRTLLHDERMPSFKDMAYREFGSEQEREQRRNVYETYGPKSTIAHARLRAIRVVVDPTSSVLRLGGHYDRDLFVSFCYCLVAAILRMMGFLAEVLRPEPPQWIASVPELMDEAREWMKSVEAEARDRNVAQGTG